VAEVTSARSNQSKSRKPARFVLSYGGCQSNAIKVVNEETHEKSPEMPSHFAKIPSFSQQTHQNSKQESRGVANNTLRLSDNTAEQIAEAAAEEQARDLPMQLPQAHHNKVMSVTNIEERV
jgi:hypothetical protein